MKDHRLMLVFGSDRKYNYNNYLWIKKAKKESSLLDLASELKKLWNMRVTVIPTVIRALGTVPKGFERVKTWRTNREHSDNWIVWISQNTEKSPADLRRFAVTHTPVKDHQQTWAWKTLKENNNKYNSIQSWKVYFLQSSELKDLWDVINLDLELISELSQQLLKRW